MDRSLAPTTDQTSQILNLVSVSADRKRTEVGQSVNVELSIRPTFTWSHKKGTLGDAVQLEYDVVVKSDDWVSSGRKRGAFTGKVSQGHFRSGAVR